MPRQAYQLDPSRNWTAAQRAAVLDRSGSLLVSAAAGTGKTAVLTERCVSWVAGPEAIDIDRLLVVTFTEAAALEMRTRIRGRLHELHDRAPSARLARQLALLDAASISTLHAFCLQVVRENFSAAGIEPDAGVLDDDEAQLLKDEVLTRLFDDLYGGRDRQSLEFAEFIAHYAPGRDEKIRACVKHLHDYLRSLPPPQRDQWKRAAVAAYALAQDGTLTAEQLNQLREGLTDEIDLLLEISRVRLDAFRAQISPHKGLESGEAVHEYVSQLQMQLSSLTTAASLDAWTDQAAKLPWGRVNKWGDVPEALKGGAKWLYDEWRRDFATKWLAPAAAWNHGIRLAAPHAQLLIRLVNRFDDQYAAHKRRIGRIDYGDMEEHAFGVLAGPDATGSDVARACRLRYQAILVDEFQDINPIQAAILRLVSRESDAPPEPNLFAVGDVKQSIYGFRMTDPQEFLKRHDLIAAGRVSGATHALQANFRSRPEILRAINHVFGHLMTRAETRIEYDESAALKPGRTDSPPARGPCVELHLLDGGKPPASDDDTDATSTDAPPGADADGQDDDRLETMFDRQKEAYLVAGRIQQLVGQPYPDGDGTRPLSYRDVVVLLRSTRDAAQVYADVLRRCGIPVHAELRSGYFASREIQDMLALLAVLKNMQQDIPLAAVLRSPLFGKPLTDADLAEVRLARPDLDFHQAVRVYTQAGRDQALRQKVARRLDRLDRWRGDARLQPLAEVIAAIYHETGALEYAALLDDGPQCRANLVSLYERARQFGQFSRQGLRRFITFVNEMIRAGREASSPTAVSEAQDVVRVMSIHAAKGLEFPVVFLADLGRKFNDKDFNDPVVVDRSGLLGIEARDPARSLRSDTLVKLLAARKVRQQNRAEELRVLYVAMTRARERLVLVGTPRKDPQEWLQDCQQLWGNRPGPLPRHVLRYAHSPLDWIVPALASPAAPQKDHRFDWRIAEQPAAPAGDDLVAVTVYPREHADRWRIAQTRERLDGDSIVAALDRTAGAAGGSTAAVDPIVARLTQRYRHEDLTRLPAIRAATELKGRLDWLDDEESPAAAVGALSPRPLVSHPDSQSPCAARRSRRLAKPGHLVTLSPGQPFPIPRRLRAVQPADLARRRGVATHLFLQKLELAGPTDLPALQAQLHGMVASRILSQAEADQIDLPGADWLLNETSLGRQMRQHHDTIRREQPFILRLPPQTLQPGLVSDDPADAVVVRGVIDVLWFTPDGIEIADYKTDVVSGRELAARIRFYKDQLNLYAQAIRRIWLRPVQRVWLAFLDPRHLEPLVPEPLRG